MIQPATKGMKKRKTLGRRNRRILHNGYQPVIIATKLDKIKKSQLQKQLNLILDTLDAAEGTVIIHQILGIVDIVEIDGLGLARLGAGTGKGFAVHQSVDQGGLPHVALPRNFRKNDRRSLDKAM